MGPPHPYAQYIAGLLRRDGFVRVRLEHEVRKRIVRPRGRRSIPFDIAYPVPPLLMISEYVECKYREDKVASERDVSKFIADLDVCGIAREQGLVVTTHGYQPLAIDYARKAGVRLYVVRFAPHDKHHPGFRHRLSRFIDQYQTGVRLPVEFRKIA